MKRSLFVLSSLIVAGCAGNAGVLKLASGEWGGQNIDLQVSETGATAQFKCGAVGKLTEPLNVDANGHFTTGGTYEPKLIQGGPRAAQYDGTLSGARMLLSVRVANDTLGPFDLTQGQAGTFEPCNFD